MKPILSVLVVLSGLILGWIALATDSPTFRVEPEPDIPASVPYGLTGEVPEGCVVRSLEVEGICCAGCAGKLYLALQGVDQVREVAIDPVLEVAEAVVPEDLDVHVLEAALTFDKYSAHLAH